MARSPSALPTLAIAEARRVAAAAEAEIGLLLSDLRTWVDVDSPTGESEQLDGLAQIIAEQLDRYGFRSELVRPGSRPLYLHAGIAGVGQARVALLCHHDTVFPMGTAAARPFSSDGVRVYGPGVADMKGGIAVAAHAARLLAHGPRQFAWLELVSVPDEEVREGGAPATIDRLKTFDAVLCMECGREDHSIVSARKAGYWMQMTALGRQAHAGVDPDAGRNAIIALCREALRLSGIHRAREGLSMQVTTFHGGEGLNTVPGRATLAGDLRARTLADLDWAVRQIKQVDRHEGVDLRVEKLTMTPPLERTPAVAALAQAAIRLGAEVGHVFGEAETGGASDGSFTAAAGVPTLDGLGPVGGLDHTPYEYAECGTFAPRCGVVAGLVAAIDAGLLDGLRRQSSVGETS